MKTRILSLALALAAIGGAQAQTSSLLLGSDFVPQRTYLNPSFFPETHRVYVALPGLNFVGNGMVAFNDILRYDKEQSSNVLDMNKLIEATRDGHHFFTDADMNLFGFGVRLTPKWFFTFSSEIRGHIVMGLPQELVGLLEEGNGGRYGDPRLAASNEGFLHATAYTQLALGLGYEPLPGLKFGLRAKKLRGIMDANAADLYLGYVTNEHGLPSPDLMYRMRLCLPFKHDSAGFHPRYLHLPKGNRGFAFDLGAAYTAGKWDFSAAVLDLGGKVKWKNDIYMSAPKLDSTTTGGVGDSLAAAWGMDSNGVAEPYTTKMPTRFNLGIGYNVLPSLKLGLAFQGEVDKTLTNYDGSVAQTLFYYNATLMANYKVKEWLELSLGNSIVSYGSGVRAFNLSYGATVTVARTIQLYVLIDHLNHTHLLEATHANVYYGLNILAGKGTQRRMELSQNGQQYAL